MSRQQLAGALGCGVAWLTLALPVFGGPARRTDDAKVESEQEAPRPNPWMPRPIRLVANEVIQRAMPGLLEAPSDTALRVSVKDGLVGLGSYNPRGGADLGMHAPPRHLFPGAGVGNSLNVDPNTGRSYFTNTP